MAIPEKYTFLLLSLLFLSSILLLSSLSGFSASLSLPPRRLPRLLRGPHHLPSFAFLLSGKRGDSQRLLRLLLAVYHPRNRYLIHLSSDAPERERMELAARVWVASSAIRSFGNVDVIGKSDPMTNMGASELAATLHAAALLLRVDDGWDWFVALSADDYPLVTQDDLIHAFSSVPRDLNFVDHTSDLGWKESQRVQPIIVDASIYLLKRNMFFQASEKRETPESFKFFTGSPWVILSRSFLEYCVLGWDNLPRSLLLYFTNVMLPREGYFHSVICNSPDFQNSTVNSDLRYVAWDDPPKMEPHFLNLTNYDSMVGSGMPFARKFEKDAKVLDRIDSEILNRWRYTAVPGAWCSGRRSWFVDPCGQWNNANIVRPGPQAEKFGRVMRSLVEEWKSQSKTCIT